MSSFPVCWSQNFTNRNNPIPANGEFIVRSFTDTEPLYNALGTHLIMIPMGFYADPEGGLVYHYLQAMRVKIRASSAQVLEWWASTGIPLVESFYNIRGIPSVSAMAILCQTSDGKVKASLTPEGSTCLVTDVDVWSKTNKNIALGSSGIGIPLTNEQLDIARLSLGANGSDEAYNVSNGISSIVFPSWTSQPGTSYVVEQSPFWSPLSFIYLFHSSLDSGTTFLSSITVSFSSSNNVVSYDILVNGVTVQGLTLPLREGFNQIMARGKDVSGVVVIVASYNLTRISIVQKARLYDMDLANGAVLFEDRTVARVTFEANVFPVVKATHVQSAGKFSFQFERLPGAESIYAGIGIWELTPNSYGATFSTMILYYQSSNSVRIIVNKVETEVGLNYFADIVGIDSLGADLGVLVDVDTGTVRFVFKNQIGIPITVRQFINKKITPVMALATSSGLPSTLKLKTTAARMSVVYGNGFEPFDLLCVLP